MRASRVTANTVPCALPPDLSYCCRQLLQVQGRALGVQAAWQLLSECMVVKFSGPLARRWARTLHKPRQLVVPGGSLLASMRAMAAHHSQWVW